MTVPDDVRATMEKTLYYARATVEDYWHAWAGDANEPDSLEEIDTALDWLEAQPATDATSVQGLDFPDGVGWWAHEEIHHDYPSRGMMMITDYIERLCDAYPEPAIQIGSNKVWIPKERKPWQETWWRVYMPWEAPAPATAQPTR